MTAVQLNIIYQSNSATSVDTLPEYSHQVVIKKPLKRLSIPAETTRYSHIRSRPSLPRRFNNFGGNTLNLHEKLRLIACVLVFLYAFLAVFCLNAGFAHAQNTTQVSESAQEPETPQISLTPAEGAHTQQAPPKKNVLVLHGLWRIRTYEIPFNSSLHDALLADKAVRAGITHVYLGLEDFPDSVYPQNRIEELRDRIEKNPIDLVISFLPAANRFLLSYGQELFPGVPKVFAIPGTRDVQKITKLKNAVIIQSIAGPALQTTVESETQGQSLNCELS